MNGQLTYLRAVQIENITLGIQKICLLEHQPAHNTDQDLAVRGSSV